MCAYSHQVAYSSWKTPRTGLCIFCFPLARLAREKRRAHGPKGYWTVIQQEAKGSGGWNNNMKRGKAAVHTRLTDDRMQFICAYPRMNSTYGSRPPLWHEQLGLVLSIMSVGGVQLGNRYKFFRFFPLLLLIPVPAFECAWWTVGEDKFVLSDLR